MEVRREAVEMWGGGEGIRRDLKKTVFGGCASWYVDGEGWNSTMYP